jgi:hypothetical protein
MTNGGFLGVRREPNPLSAPGVWGVQDAYTADRDGVWPRWPDNAGLKLEPGLLFWLEADYGLYSDVNATVPATSNGAEVRSWVNRGTAGLVRFEPANNPMLFRPNNGSPYVELNLALAQQNPVAVKTNNYLWIKSNLLVSTSFRFLSSANTSGLPQSVFFESGAVASFPLNNTSGSGATAATSFAESGTLDVSLSTRSPLFSYYRAASARANLGGGLNTVVGGNTSINGAPLAGINANLLVRAFGEPAFLRNGRIKALIWYSTDTPLTESEFNAVSAYLGNKWGYTLTVGSFG